MKRKPMSFATTKARGASLLEFIFVFPALLLSIYLIVVYSLVFLLQQSMTYAVSEASRAAAISTAKSRDQLAIDRVNFVLTSLPTALKSKLPAPTIQTGRPASECGSSVLKTTDGFFCVRVTMTYPFASNPAIILLPGMEKLVPQTLSASASALYEN